MGQKSHIYALAKAEDMSRINEHIKLNLLNAKVK